MYTCSIDTRTRHIVHKDADEVDIEFGGERECTCLNRLSLALRMQQVAASSFGRSLMLLTILYSFTPPYSYTTAITSPRVSFAPLACLACD